MKFSKENCKIYDIGIVLISIFVILLFLNYNRKLKEEKKNEYLKKQEIQLKDFSEFYLEEYKKNIENVLEYFYKKVEYEKLGDENYKKTLLGDWEEYKKNNPYIKWIYVAYADNTMIIDKTWVKPENYQMTTRPWYTNGILSNGLTWSEPYEELSTKKVYLALTKPIKNSKGEVKALLGLDIDLEKLSDIISTFDINQENFIYDENFKIVAHTNQTFLNKDVKDMLIIKKIELSNKNHIYDEKSNAYIYYKNNLGWTMVKKIPKNILFEIEHKINKEKYFYISMYFILTSFLHVLYILKRNKETNSVFKALRSVQNRENIQKSLKKSRKSENIFQEICNIQKIIENLEKETYKDQETGLYSQNYLNYNIGEFLNTDKKILLLNYENLSEIKNQHGKNVVELVLKRGAMTLNALKEIDEVALRLNKETLGIIINPNEIEKKSNYIISEILNYKWKMHNIYLKLSWEIMTVEEYLRNN